jgi:hypothetical protein
VAELSPLRRRMIGDMTVPNLSPATQRSYDGQEEPPTSGPDETISLDPPPCPECDGVMRAIADLPRGDQWA